MEALLLKLVIGLIVIGAVFMVVRIVLPQLGLPGWITQVVMLLLGVIVLIWLLLTLVPLLHVAL